jgi:hypothetical protein
LTRLRIRARAVLSLAAVGFAVHVLLPQVAELGQTIRALATARVDWLLAALVLSAMRYPTSAVALVGAVREPLGLARTTLVQLAASLSMRSTI